MCQILNPSKVLKSLLTKIFWMICQFNTCIALSVLIIRYLKKCKLKILSLVLNMFNDKKSRY